MSPAWCRGPIFEACKLIVSMKKPVSGNVSDIHGAELNGTEIPLVQ